MIVNGMETKSVLVKIDAKNTFDELLNAMMRSIAPDGVNKYDDWYISDGHVKGVTENFHGSDSITTVCAASSDLIMQYNAINTVQEMNRKLGAKIEKFL